jgi:isochorismate hydrolase
MTSEAIRDPLADHLITPHNSAFLLVDWQPTQIATVRSADQDLLLRNAVSTVRTVKAYGVPVVHSTVNVASGQQQPTVPELAELVQDDEPLDRTTMNSWEDVEFVAAVRATGRRKLIICALWTEICMAFVALDALREGTRCIPWSMRSAAPRWRLIALGSSEPSRRERNRSAGCRLPASCSAIGLVSKPFRHSSRSS